MGSHSRFGRVALSGQTLLLAAILSGSNTACERKAKQTALVEDVPASVMRRVAPPVMLNDVPCEPGYKAFATRDGGALCVQPTSRADRLDPKRSYLYANSVLRATLDEAQVFVGSTPYPGALLLSVRGPSHLAPRR
jgi:hypothetical protein